MRRGVCLGVTGLFVSTRVDFYLARVNIKVGKSAGRFHAPKCSYGDVRETDKRKKTCRARCRSLLHEMYRAMGPYLQYVGLLSFAEADFYFTEAESAPTQLSFIFSPPKSRNLAVVACEKRGVKS